MDAASEVDEKNITYGHKSFLRLHFPTVSFDKNTRSPQMEKKKHENLQEKSSLMIPFFVG